MKKILIVIFVSFFGITLLAQTAYAVLPLPFGGRVLSSNIPGIVCPGTGPVTIAPDGVAPPTPYYIAPGIPAGYGLAFKSSYILGLYSAKLFPICATAGGEPVLVFPVLMYGISSPTL